METTKIIDSVIKFADTAHGSQTRKYSKARYIVHPVRVMQMVRPYIDEKPVLSAAILHDILEDTPVTKIELFEFLIQITNHSDAEKTVKLVVELTDVYIKENFLRMNRWIRKKKEAERLSMISYEAQTIKYADIIDNTDVTHHDPVFARTYLKEADMFLFRMKTGHPYLREKAIKRVKACMEILKTDASA